MEIALREFGGLSSRAIAELCGVSNHFVDSIREALGTVPNATRTTTDGRQYPARRPSRPTTPEQIPEGDCGAGWVQRVNGMPRKR